MTEDTGAPDRHFIIHDDYVEVVFTDGMTKEELHAVHQKADDVAAKLKDEDKPILVLADVSEQKKPDFGLFNQEVRLLDTDGLKAVAIYGQQDGPIRNLAVSVISSFSSVMPMKFFSDRTEALEWLRTNR